MRDVADHALRGHLLTALMALLPYEEMVSMVERLLEEDEWLLELPYLRRIRAEGHAEGRREGEAEVLRRLLRSRFGALPEAARIFLDSVRRYAYHVSDRAEQV